jgi:glycosyltransferase involved in cell wall biosynthesis
MLGRLSPSMTALRQFVVVPCYNEADRMDADRLLTFLDHRGIELVLVDDGSTDATPSMLSRLASKDPARVRVLTLDGNSGKGEAVRRGMLGAVAAGADLVGYFDADIATSPDEMVGLFDGLTADPDIDVAIASRVALLGRDVRRSEARHWIGRVFATLASLALAVPIYDTQCGAKAFRVTPTLEAAIGAPFFSRWGFDVELLGRLLNPPTPCRAVGAERMVEVPLRAWRDVGGSRIDLRKAPLVAANMSRMLVHVRRDRRKAAAGRSADQDLGVQR